ncbi:MAG: histidine--tRNA ligase [Candidatus Omnitrophica bacterium]|nr:histidine--tRNA ligase [Candidatus Omnitrophota bacterium]
MFKSLRGTQDILPEDIKAWSLIEDISRKKLAVYGYREIRTPIIEEAGLFTRSVGQDSDIVKKQMYSFQDQGGRNICLRPEETAAVVRAYLENHLDKKEGFSKLFYIGPMFRSERPQAGRMRQFHQVGVEAIGSYSPYLDAEIIILLDELLRGYGLSENTFKINSLGCDKDKEAIKKFLKETFKGEVDSLCDDCRRRYETNILRMLDCKRPSCRKVLSSASSLESCLCKDCSDDFDKLRQILDDLGLRYEVTPNLVRGLDYYTKVVFEVVTKGLGAQDAVAAGGRYDNLIAEFGGTATGACGFAIGIERVIESLSKVAPPGLEEERGVVFIATLGEEAYKEGFKILKNLRSEGIPADIDYQQKSLKAQMRYADKLKARSVVIIGEDELKSNSALIKDMAGSTQKSVALPELTEELKKC